MEITEMQRKMDAAFGHQVEVHLIGKKSLLLESASISQSLWTMIRRLQALILQSHIRVSSAITILWKSRRKKSKNWILRIKALHQPVFGREPVKVSDVMTASSTMSN